MSINSIWIGLTSEEAIAYCGVEGVTSKSEILDALKESHGITTMAAKATLVPRILKNMAKANRSVPFPARKKTPFNFFIESNNNSNNAQSLWQEMGASARAPYLQMAKDDEGRFETECYLFLEAWRAAGGATEAEEDGEGKE